VKPLDPIAFLSSGKSVGRWGDGEWHAVLGTRGVNVDRCSYAHATADLRRCITAKDHAVLSLQPLARRRMWGQIRKWLERNAKHRLEQEWHDSHYLVDLVKRGRMKEFTKELAKFKSVLIGAAHLKKLGITDHFIEVPPRDAIKKVGKISIPDGVQVVLGSAGFLGTKLAHAFCNREFTYMDVGSVFDPYVGRKSRTNWTRMINKKLLPPLR